MELEDKSMERQKLVEEEEDVTMGATVQSKITPHNVNKNFSFDTCNVTLYFRSTRPPEVTHSRSL